MNDTNKNNTVLRFLTCGSVDDGKSTLIGRLLFDTKTILTDTLSQIEKSSKKIITIHLGNGCSMSAIKDGKSIENSMGFAPMAAG